MKRQIQYCHGYHTGYLLTSENHTRRTANAKSTDNVKRCRAGRIFFTRMIEQRKTILLPFDSTICMGTRLSSLFFWFLNGQRYGNILIDRSCYCIYFDSLSSCSQFCLLGADFTELTEGLSNVQVFPYCLFLWFSSGNIL